ncbi:hypothetical protein BH23GEM5_BH23GEM5_03120 [soil metagenome]
MLGGREAPAREPAQEKQGGRAPREPARAGRRGNAHDDFKAPPYEEDDDLPF